MSEKGFLAEAIQLILDKSRPVTVDVDGVSFWADNHKEIEQDIPPFPALSVNTLSGLADVIKAESEWDGTMAKKGSRLPYYGNLPPSNFWNGAVSGCLRLLLFLLAVGMQNIQEQPHGLFSGISPAAMYSCL